MIETREYFFSELTSIGLLRTWVSLTDRSSVNLFDTEESGWLVKTVHIGLYSLAHLLNCLNWMRFQLTNGSAGILIAWPPTMRLIPGHS